MCRERTDLYYCDSTACADSRRPPLFASASAGSRSVAFPFWFSPSSVACWLRIAPGARWAAPKIRLRRRCCTNTERQGHRLDAEAEIVVIEMHLERRRSRRFVVPGERWVAAGSSSATDGAGSNRYNSSAAAESKCHRSKPAPPSRCSANVWVWSAANLNRTTLIVDSLMTAGDVPLLTSDGNKSGAARAELVMVTKRLEGKSVNESDCWHKFWAVKCFLKPRLLTWQRVVPSATRIQLLMPIENSFGFHVIRLAFRQHFHGRFALIIIVARVRHQIIVVVFLYLVYR